MGLTPVHFKAVQAALFEVAGLSMIVADDGWRALVGAALKVPGDSFRGWADERVRLSPTTGALENSEFFVLLFVEFLGVRFFCRRGFYGLGLIGAGAAVHVSRPNVNPVIFAQLGEIGTKRRLQLLIVEFVVNLLLHLF
jgi:hypothetical protein